MVVWCIGFWGWWMIVTYWFKCLSREDRSAIMDSKHLELWIFCCHYFVYWWIYMACETSYICCEWWTWGRHTVNDRIYSRYWLIRNDVDDERLESLLFNKCCMLYFVSLLSTTYVKIFMWIKHDNYLFLHGPYSRTFNFLLKHIDEW